MSDTVKDPVCGMRIRVEDAAASEEHDGRMFHFCSDSCHKAFLADPHRYGHPSDQACCAPSSNYYPIKHVLIAPRPPVRPRGGTCVEARRA